MTQPTERRFVMEPRLDAEIQTINDALATKITNPAQEANIADGAVTSAKIANGTIVDADINSAAAIAATKISGTAVTQADTGTVTSTMIANGTIVDADINASAAIAKTKIAGTAVTQADTGTVTGTMIADNTITSVDLATLDYIKFNTAYAGGSTQPGMLNWNDTDGTLEFELKGGNVTLQIGQEQVIRVKNNTGAVLSNGKAVYISGSDGINLRVAYANAGSESTSAGTIGILTEDLNNGNAGYITTFGLVRGIDTSTLVEGSPVWLSTTDGVLTATRPAAPNHSVMLGFCLNKHAVNGVVFVRVDNGWELDELHNVLITAPSNGQALTYDSATQLWKNATPISSLAGLSDVTFTSPVNGQVIKYDAASGKWINGSGGGGGGVTAQATAPALSGASNGDAWFNTTDGSLYVCFVDVDSTKQWVQVKSDATLSSTLGSRVDALDYGANVNYIINGGMDIWQRGTSFSAAGYTADRWILLADGTGATRAITQQAFTPGNAIAGYEPTFFLRYNQSVAGSSATYNIIEQRVEDVRTLAGQAVTVSFWAKSDANRTITAQVQQNFGSGGSAEVQAIATQSVALTTSWRRFTYTATMPSISGKTIGTNSYVAVRINLPNNATFTVDIWGVQFQKGNTVTDFHRSMPTLQGELAACQRYYQRFSNTGANSGAVPVCASIGFASSATAGWVVVQPIVPLRANLGSNSQVSFSSLYFDNQATYGSAITGVVLNDNGGVRQTQNAISLKLTGMTGLTTNAPYWLITSAAGGYIAFDSEL